MALTTLTNSTSDAIAHQLHDPNMAAAKIAVSQHCLSGPPPAEVPDLNRMRGKIQPN
jgi:hypothetical protein